ncbi:MAG: glycosyltransferase family 2 protein [Bacteroidales bacterium]|nr:glycosyltransferase family 2 protein [Bacteroidales bacterium]
MSKDTRICVIVPTYNNAGTVADVVRRVLALIPDVIVVNDGSTDDTLLRLEGLPITLVSYEANKGKGGALREGLLKARSLGFTNAITLDSDGQHFPEDLPLFFDALAADPDALIVGSRNLNADGMPAGNTFANKFSNFWFDIQTLRRLPDTQTGFRAYPISKLPCLKLLTARYESELELLVLSAWKGVKLVPVPIRVDYPEDRVTHFHPVKDFARISLLNTVLCLLALVYGYPRMALSKIFGI